MYVQVGITYLREVSLANRKVSLTYRQVSLTYGRYHLPTGGITYLQVGITYLQVIPRAICGVIKCKISDLVSFHHRTLCYSYLIDNLFLLLLSKHFKADVPQTDNRPNSIYANDIQAQNKFLYMGQSRPLFCLFSSLSHSNSKYSSISTK